VVCKGTRGARRETAAAVITAPALATEPCVPIFAYCFTPTPNARHGQSFQYILD
jgi:hypothetical protein